MEILRAFGFREWFIVGMFVVLSVGSLALIWQAIRAPRYSHEDPEKRAESQIFRVGLYLLAWACFVLVMLPDASGSQPQRQSRRIVLDLADCPPMGKGMTPVVMFIVDTTAEVRPGRLNAHCTRMAQRQYTVTPKEK